MSFLAKNINNFFFHVQAFAERGGSTGSIARRRVASRRGAEKLAANLVMRRGARGSRGPHGMERLTPINTLVARTRRTEARASAAGGGPRAPAPLPPLRAAEQPSSRAFSRTHGTLAARVGSARQTSTRT